MTRLAKDRAQQHSDDDVLHEIGQRLREETKHPGEFVRVHSCPESSADIPDETETRLVVLPPGQPHIQRNDDSPALSLIHI